MLVKEERKKEKRTLTRQTRVREQTVEQRNAGEGKYWIN